MGGMGNMQPSQQGPVSSGRGGESSGAQNPPTNPLAGLDLMGMMSSLNQNGGMGALMGMSLG